jgi:hypothetical protein
VDCIPCCCSRDLHGACGCVLPVRAMRDAASHGPTGRQKFHFTFKDGREMYEEFDASSGAILGSSLQLSILVFRAEILGVGICAVRRWRGKTTLGATTPWEYEIGDEPMSAAAQDAGIALASTNVCICLGCASLEARAALSLSCCCCDWTSPCIAPQPIFVRSSDTKNAFQWRIRNLPYPLEVYRYARLCE